ncbi:MAG: hypothetical protein ACLU4A_09790 [Collinsella aerofaciens]
MINNFPRVLIVGTVPYNKKSTSRAFESYFHGWDKDCLAQVFSNTRTPVKGHCKYLYQITDQRLVKRRFNKSVQVGKQFNYDELPDEWIDDDLEVNSSTFSWLYRFGSRSTHWTHLARKIVWSKRLWCTPGFNDWIDSFKPDCVFLSFSNDYFILEIALYVAERFNIPIVSSIGDDCYFDTKRSVSPLYWIYKFTYRQLVDRVFAHGGSAIYIGNKIRDKYNSEFALNGKTVYLTSEATRHDFRPIDLECPKIRYFGNIRLGRNESLCAVANVLSEINPKYHIEVYSNETDPKFCSPLIKNPHVIFNGSIPYSSVLEKTVSSDILLVVEGFKKSDVDITRYSLSTKVADALTSGSAVVGFGSQECGAIEYMQDCKCCCVGTSEAELKRNLEKLFGDIELQKKNFELAKAIVEQNHTLANSTAVFRSVIQNSIKGYDDGIA